jgi:predicted nucleotidyltransferase
VQINRERINKPADPVLRIPQAAFQPPVRAAIDELLDELESVIGIQVYGSVARGEADRRSDIDLWVLVQENRSRNQRRANDVANTLGDRQFDGDRYEFHIVVEAPNSLPQFTEDIAHIVASGIPVYETDEYDQFRAILEDLIDE